MIPTAVLCFIFITLPTPPVLTDIIVPIDTFEIRVLREVRSKCGEVCDEDRVRAMLELPGISALSCSPSGPEPCHQCQCDSDCFVYGDCCPDLVLFSNATESGVEFFGTKCLKFKQDFDESLIINTITTCGKGGLSAKNSANCSIRNPYSVWDITPVVNPKTGETFLNKECAECNGVQNGVSFEPVIQCSTLINMDRFSNQEELIRAIVTKSHQSLESCDVMLKAPALSVQYRYCNGDAVGDCDDGLENITDEFQEKACRTLHWNKGYNQYKNLFCEECNNHSSSFFYCGGGDSSIGMGTAQSLAILLDFNRPDPEVAEKITNRECTATQVYNPQKAKCQNVVCAPGKILQGDMCTPTFPHANGQFYWGYVNLKPEKLNHNTMSTDTIQQLGRGLMMQFQHELMLTSMMSTVVFDSVPQSAILSAPAVVRIYADTETTLNSSKSYTISRIVINARIITTIPHSVDRFEKTLLETTEHTRMFGELSLVPHFDMYEDFTWEDYLHTQSQSYLVESNHKANNSVLLTEIVSNYPNENTSTFFNDLTSSKSTLKLISPTLFCPMVVLDETDFVLFENKTVYIKSAGVMATYERFRELGDGTISVCVEDAISNSTDVIKDVPDSYLQKFQGAQGILTLVMTCLSIFCLFLTTVTYCVFPSMRTLPGAMNMCLAITLISAQISFQFGIGQIENDKVCIAIGLVMHFLWLSSFCWMNICSMHMAKTFLYSRVSKPRNNYKCRLTIYASYTIVTPAIIVSATVLINLLTTNRNDIGYGGHICFLSSAFLVGVSFALPLGIIIVLNAISFTITVRSIRIVHRVAGIERDYLYTYMRLSTLTGVTWLLGFLAELVDFEPLWYGFIVCNAGQGILIFFSFVVGKKTLILWKEKISSNNDSTNSCQPKSKTSILANVHSSRL